MKLTPALEWEKQRPAPEDWTKVLLNKEGKFYRAYDGSAWLLKQFLCTEAIQQQRGDAKVLAATFFKTKAGGYVMIGFPVESLSKFLIGYTDARTTDEGDIIANIESPFSADTPVEQIQADYEQWKAALPVKESARTSGGSAAAKKDNRQGITPSDQPMFARSGLFGIVAQVLSYPIETSTPAQNIEFISSLKQQVASML